MKWLWLCLLSSLSFAQTDIQSIIERDPFDPNRGQKEAEEEEAPVEEAPAIDLPILDGTMIIGKSKYAIFTYIEEGKPVTTRVKLKDKIAGYTLASVGPSSARLKGLGGRNQSIEVFAEKKNKKRGASKKAAKATKPGKKPTKPRSSATPIEQAGKKDPRISSTKKASPTPKRRQAPKRKTPPKISKSVQDRKTKF